MKLWRWIKPFNFVLIAVICFVAFNEKPAHAEAIHSNSFLFEEALKKSKNAEFVEALTLWDQLLQDFPDDAVALSNRGNVRLALGDSSGAIEDQSRAMELLPFESDPHLNRGTAEEALQLWKEAEVDYNWILKRNPNDPSALYNLGNVRGSQGNWLEAKSLFAKASFAQPGFAMACSSKALANYQLGDFDQAESELRTLIRKYPMFADARAALSALLWQQGLFGEAESHWVAAFGLDSRYKYREWLINVRRWPPKPTQDLMSFLALDRSE